MDLTAIGIAQSAKLFVNVKDFGAKGDGTTDDTLAIQNAIDYCANKGGGVVLVPLPGKYLFSNLIVKPYVTLKMDALDNDYTATDNSLPATNLLSYCFLRKTGSTGDGITVQAQGILSNVNINGNNVAGICVASYGYISGLVVVRAEDALHAFSTCSFLDKFYLYGNTGNGLTLNIGTNDMRITEFNISSNLGYGILFLGGGTNHFSHGKIEWNYKDNVCVNTWLSQISWDDCVIDASNWFDFHVMPGAGCMTTRFSNCLIIGSRRDSTTIMGVTDPRVGVTPVGVDVRSQFLIEGDVELSFDNCQFRMDNTTEEGVHPPMPSDIFGSVIVDYSVSRISLSNCYTDFPYANLWRNIYVEHKPIVALRTTDLIDNKEYMSGVIPILPKTTGIPTYSPQDLSTFLDITSHKVITYVGGNYYDLSGSLAYGTIPIAGTTGTLSVDMVSSDVRTITPTGACTFNASGGVIGKRCTFIITTSGTTAYTLTFGTNFKTIGTLSTGTTSGKVFAISFVCKDGTTWVETGRTAAM